MRLIKNILRKPYRKIIYITKNILRKPYRAARQFIYSFNEKKVNIISVKEWCEQNDQPYHVISTERTVHVKPPAFICDNNTPQIDAVDAILPEIYLAQLSNVKIIECSDIVITNAKTAIYDEMALDSENRYEERNNLSRLINSWQRKPNRLGLNFKTNRKTKLPQTVIHFCKDYSPNYFHWMIEALPRLSIIDKFPELKNTPILVDETLYPQQIEALEYLIQGEREIIRLNKGDAYHINQLIYPSCLSHIHNNYYYPIDYRKDVVISPDAIRYLKNRFKPLTDESKPTRKIYLSRKSTGANKRIENDDEIAAFLVNLGFEIVLPETLSFAEQVKLFSQATIVIGASGSAFTNLVFVQQNTQAIILSANNPQINFNLFSTIADVSGARLTYLLGNDIAGTSSTQTHNMFNVPTHLLASALLETTS